MERNRSSTEVELSLSISGSNNQQQGNSATNARGRVSLEPNESQAVDVSDNSISVEKPEEKNNLLGKRKADKLPELGEVNAISKRSKQEALPIGPQLTNDTARITQMALLAASVNSAPGNAKTESNCSSPYSPSLSNKDRQRNTEHSTQLRDDSDISPLSLPYNTEMQSNLVSAKQDRPSQSGSVHNISPPDDTHDLENSNDDEVGAIPRPTKPRRLQLITQNNNPVYAPNQTPTKYTDGQSYSTQNLTGSGSSPTDISMQGSKYQRGTLCNASDSSKAAGLHRLGSNERGRHISSSALVLQSPSGCQLPAITFTIDNRIQTLLPVATIESVIEIFSKNCTVLLRSQKMPAQHQTYTIDCVIWQHAQDFYKWFKGETGIPKISILVFELFNVKLELEKAFSVAVDDLSHFQMAKQYVWDFFWAASELNNGPTPLKILITTPPSLGNQALPPATRGNAIIPMPSMLLAGQHRSTKLGNSGVRTNASSSATPQAPDGLSRLHNEAGKCHPQPSIDFPPAASTSLDGTAPQGYQPRDVTRGPITALLPPEITIRLQMNGAGKVSGCYNKWVLNVTATYFFDWFAIKTGRSEGPLSLTFTFKDAMPTSTACTITKANEDYFSLMKRDLKTQYKRAREYVPGLNEFCVLVTDPEWVSEEEDW
ncbi:hypothetical protein BGZ60DRAFT_526339 [Tricladium varicosporioides]|nr:hypothetical protein BGZ60DRAFT_526339 [Hymenoscyphus varicosporioides]